MQPSVKLHMQGSKPSTPTSVFAGLIPDAPQSARWHGRPLVESNSKVLYDRDGVSGPLYKPDHHQSTNHRKRVGHLWDPIMGLRAKPPATSVSVDAKVEDT